MFSDLELAFRSLRKTPAFALVAVLTLALGIGAVTAVYSVVDQVLLRPPPYADAGRLVIPFSINVRRGIHVPRIGGQDYLEWRQEQVFEHLAITDHMGRRMSLSDEAGEPELVRTNLVSRQYFAVLGISQALHGRLFTAEDHQHADGFSRCLLGYNLWRRRYNADPGMVGRTVRVDGSVCSVEGVLPRDALWPMDTDVISPMFEPSADAPAPNPGARASDFLIFGAIGRLKPDVSIEQTNVVLAALAQRAESAAPRERKGWTNRVVPLTEVVIGKRARTALLMAMAAVCCLLSIAVINVAGLLLARAITRQQELQVRAALGAGRWQLTRYLLAEGVVLATPAGILGLLLAIGILHVLSTLSLQGMPPLPGVEVDAGVFILALGVSILAALGCGLAPLTHALRRNLDSTQHRGKSGGTRLLHGLVVAEVALSVLLLAGAGLLIRSFMEIQRLDAGFQGERLLAFAVTLLTPAQIPPDDREQVLSIYRDLTTRVAEAPGVLGATASTSLPSGGGGEYYSTFFSVEGRSEPGAGGDHPAFMAGDAMAQSDWYGSSAASADHPAMVNVVSSGFFSTLGIPLLAGRDFDSRDTPDGKPVIIISETLARRAFPNESPVGKRIRSSLDALHGAGYSEIIGVAADVRYLGREDELRALVYLPHARRPMAAMMLSVRTTDQSSATLARIRGYIEKIHPNVVVSEAKSMTDILDQSVAPRRSGMALFAVLAGAALLLSAIGLYGVLSYIIARRTHEIGVRMALGARRKNILRMVIGRGLRMTSLGMALGLAAAFLLTPLMAHLLYEVSATDPMTLIAIAALLAIVALAACYLPARRATRVNPLVALRTE